MWSELKPEVVLATIIDQKGVNSLKMPINGLGLLCLEVLLAQRSFLADRTIGRAFGTLSCVCRLSSVTFSIMAKRYVLAKN